MNCLEDIKVFVNPPLKLTSLPFLFTNLPQTSPASNFLDDPWVCDLIYKLFWKIFNSEYSAKKHLRKGIIFFKILSSLYFHHFPSHFTILR